MVKIDVHSHPAYRLYLYVDIFRCTEFAFDHSRNVNALWYRLERGNRRVLTYHIYRLVQRSLGGRCQLCFYNIHAIKVAAMFVLEHIFCQRCFRCFPCLRLESKHFGSEYATAFWLHFRTSRRGVFMRGMGWSGFPPPPVSFQTNISHSTPSLNYFSKLLTFKLVLFIIL